MVNSIQKNLLTNRLNKYLGRRLEVAIKIALNSILENEIESGFKYKIEANLKQAKAMVVRSMRISYVDLFETERDASQYVTTFFNTYSAVTVHNYLVKKRYYKTPHDGIVYIPQGEITDYSPNGGVYGFKVGNRYFYWDYSEELYYDLYSRVYNPHGDIIVGNRSPRYIKEAYKKLTEVRIKHPTAKLSDGFGNDLHEIFITHRVGNDIINFGGAYFNDKAFNERDYPEPHGVGAYTPVVGSFWQATHDFQDGDYGWAAVNVVMGVSDVFLVNSIRKGLGQAIWKKGFYTGTKKYFGINMSHTYGASTGRWKEMGLRMGSGGSKDHWMFTQKLMEKHTWLKPIGNQTWNLNKFSSHAKHMRFGHGKAFPSLDLGKPLFWKFQYPIRSTPLWFKSAVYSSGSRVFQNYKRNE
ncbi:MAG: hypothetical protein L3J20_06415 [Flavobacteriaceae bacterium]|nr:hypothetical protein [Flavobacteriaceae bacterium]